jgi:hypothetical protein
LTKLQRASSAEAEVACSAHSAPPIHNKRIRARTLSTLSQAVDRRRRQATTAPLQPTSLGVATPSQCQLGAIRSPRRQPVAIARSVYRATVCCTLAASGNTAGGAALADHRLERLDSTHHPYLGLDRDPSYSALGGKQSVSWQALDALSSFPIPGVPGGVKLPLAELKSRAFEEKVPKPSLWKVKNWRAVID